MPGADLLLAIDNGTQSLKTLVFDLEGNLLAKQQVYFEAYKSPRPGWAEQDPALFWDSLCCACRKLWKEKPGLKTAIAGVALTCQRGTVVNLDRYGRPLRPAILWLDQRKSPGLPPMSGLWGWFFRLSGLGRTMNYLRSEAEACWIAANQPEIWNRSFKYLLLSGYLTYRLTGKWIDSSGCQVGYIPFDYKRLQWARRWDWHWRCLPVKPAMLPELKPPGEILGTVCKEASRQTGIPAGLPLVAAASDKACEVIGCGSLTPDIGCLSYGTTATVNVSSRKYVEPISMMPAYPAAMPGCHNVEIQVYRGYWMVNWFKEQFGHPECREAARYGINAEVLFERFLEKVPASSMGLMLQPYWTPGLKSPGPEAKGAIIGFGDVHTRHHLYRSILEGLAYALREGKERIEKRTRVPVTSLRVSGGGSQSDHALQLTADVFGLPVARPHVYEASGLGAAIDAAVGLKLHPDFSSAVAAMTRSGPVFEPDPSNQRLYDSLFRKVYCKMYKRLKPLYKQIRKITGYPA